MKEAIFVEFRPTSLLLSEFSGFRDCGEKCRGERDNYSLKD